MGWCQWPQEGMATDSMYLTGNRNRTWPDMEGEEEQRIKDDDPKDEVKSNRYRSQERNSTFIH